MDKLKPIYDLLQSKHKFVKQEARRIFLSQTVEEWWTSRLNSKKNKSLKSVRTTDQFAYVGKWNRKRKLIKQLGEAQNHRCCYCGVVVIYEGKQCRQRATVERVIPGAIGGTYCYANCVLACNRCNLIGSKAISHILFHLGITTRSSRAKVLEALSPLGESERYFLEQIQVAIDNFLKTGRIFL